MPDIAEAIIKVGVDGASEAQGALGGLSGSLSSLAGIAGGIALAGITALSGALAISVNEAFDAQDALANLNATMAATGGNGFTSEQLQNMAGGLQDVTRFSDEAAEAAEAVLLRYESIGHDVFPDALKITADLAQSMGIDLAGAAEMVGRALDNPAEGIGRLNQKFKLFNKTQLDAIMEMANAGDVAGAQAVIMDALQKKVGGVAEAMADAGRGPFIVFQHKLSDIAESVGNAVTPVLGTLLDLVSGPLLNALNNVVPVADLVGKRFNEFFGLLGAGMSPLDAFKETINDLVPPGFFENLVPPELASALENLVGSFGNLGASVQSTFPAMQEAGQKFIDWLPNMIPVLTSIVNNTASTVNNLAALWAEWGPKIIPIIGTAAQLVVATIGGMLTLITMLTAAGTAAMRGDWDSAGKAITSGISSFVGSVTSIFGQSLPEFQATWSNNWETFKVILSKAGELIVSTVQGFIAQVGITISTGILNAIASLRGLVSQFVQVGQDFVQGMINGAASLAGAFINTIVNMAANAVDAVEGAMGISSPARVPAKRIGVPMGQGIAQGLQSTAGLVSGAMNNLVAMAVDPVAGSTIAPVAIGGSPAGSGGGNLYVQNLNFPNVRNGAQAFDEFMAEARRRGFTPVMQGM